jgi:hypothetical protein
VSVTLQDVGNHTRRLRRTRRSVAKLWAQRVYGRYFCANGRSAGKAGLARRALLRFVDDQTLGAEAVAQIQCIVKKIASARADLCY